MSTPSITPLHQAARAYASAGIPVFPCCPGTKIPATPNGQNDETTCIEQVDAWWAEADYNVAFRPDAAGWAVVDTDGEVGEAAWQREPEDKPDTFTVRTPRGGLHRYYEGHTPPSVRRLIKGEAIDTRGGGSYVLVPPSYTADGTYEVHHERDIAPIPGWITSRLSREHYASAIGIDELDLPSNVARARVFLNDCIAGGRVAREGSGGDNQTFAVCCELLNLGVSPDCALALIEEIWNPHCIPPWTRDELGAKIENASRYAQNEAGAWALAPASEVFHGPVLDRLLAEAPKQERRSRFYPEDDDEQDRTPAAQWLFELLIQCATTVMIYGASGTFKSFIAMAFALAAATGKSTLGFDPLVRGPTFYAALEGRADIKRKRRPAWKLVHEVEGQTDFYTLPAPMLAFPEEVQEFGDQIRARLAGRKPAMIVLDTVSKMMVGLDPTRDAPRLVRFCDSLVEAFDCAVVALHHVGHDEKKGPRDSSAYYAGFDTVIELKGNKAQKVTAARVLKHKDAQEPEHPFAFQGKPVANSLVFQRISEDEHSSLTATEEPMEARKVGAALQNLNAYGPDQAVSTQVLASSLTAPIANESVEQSQAAVGKTARALGALARTRLAAYCDRVEGKLVWSLPTPQ